MTATTTVRPSALAKRSAFVENVTWLRDAGESWHVIAGRLGYSLASLPALLRRYGAHDLAREADAQLQREKAWRARLRPLYGEAVAS